MWEKVMFLRNLPCVKGLWKLGSFTSNLPAIKLQKAKCLNHHTNTKLGKILKSKTLLPPLSSSASSSLSYLTVIFLYIGLYFSIRTEKYIQFNLIRFFLFTCSVYHFQINLNKKYSSYLSSHLVSTHQHLMTC